MKELKKENYDISFTGEAQSEGAIHSAIFTNYNPDVRPTLNHSIPTNVSVQFFPLQLSEVVSNCLSKIWDLSIS